MTIDLSKITDLETRKEAVRLYTEWRDLEEQAQEQTWMLTDEQNAQLNALDAEYKERKLKIIARDEVLDRSAERARLAYDNFESPALLEDTEGGVVTCAISGIPIWDDDEVLEDYETGEIILRCFTDLPPRISEEAEEVEEAA